MTLLQAGTNGNGNGSKPKKKSGDFSEIGLTGLKQSMGFVREEFLKQLQDRKAIQVYREMRDNDPTVGALIFAIDMLARQVTWREEPASEEEQDVAAAEFLKECREDMSMSWTDVISEIMSMAIFGFSYHEIVYKYRTGNNDPDAEDYSKFDDGRIGWRKLPIRAQETLFRWKFDDNGGLLGFEQQAPPNMEIKFIPITDALLFRTSVHKNNPQGRSTLRNAYRPWYFKKRIEEIEGVGIERDLAGLPVVHVDPEIMTANASADQKALLGYLKELVVSIRRDEQEGVVFPRSYDDNGNILYELQLLNAGGKRNFDTSGIIARKSQEIAMTVMADFILLGHEKVGSFALSSDKTDMFGVALGSWLDMIQDVFNTYAIPRLFARNAFNLEKLPKLVHGDVETPDLAALGSYLQALSSAGMPLFPDEKLSAFLRDAADMPALDKEAEEQPVSMQQQQMEMFRMKTEEQANAIGTPSGTTRKPGEAAPPTGNGTGAKPGEKPVKKLMKKYWTFTGSDITEDFNPAHWASTDVPA